MFHQTNEVPDLAPWGRALPGKNASPHSPPQATLVPASTSGSQASRSCWQAAVVASGILFITKISPGCLGLSFAVRSLRGLWSQAATRRPECLWKCGSRWAGQASREPWDVVGGSTSVLFLLLHRQPARKNALRTHGQPPLPDQCPPANVIPRLQSPTLPNLQPVGWG